MVLIATGSEVQLAVEAQKLLAAQDINARVVSMTCLEWFESQPPTTATRCCCRRCPLAAVEAGIAQCWHKIVGDTGEIVSIERYGESADYQTLFREFGLTAEAVVAAATRTLEN